MSYARALRQRGFSIVEALVALVVLSIGMLGIAALYVESLRAGRSAIYRTQAVNLATDLADRIRANRQAGAAYALAAGATRTPGSCAATRTEESVNCSPEQLANDDLARWLESLRQQLPGAGAEGLPSGSVTVTPAGFTNQYSIQISWSEPGDPQLTYVLNMQI